MAEPVRQRSLAEILESLERQAVEQTAAIAALSAVIRGRQRAGAKRRGTIAERSAARVLSGPVALQPTQLQVERMKRKLRGHR